MSDIPSVEEFLNMNRQGQEEIFRLGTIVDRKVLFDGESTPSNKTYKKNSNYTLNNGDRVLLAKFGGTYVILCKII